MIWGSDAERADAIERGAEQYRYLWARTLRDTADRHEVPVDRRAALGEWLRAQALTDLSAFDHLGRWMEERTAVWATETWVLPGDEPKASPWRRLLSWWRR